MHFPVLILLLLCTVWFFVPCFAEQNCSAAPSVISLSSADPAVNLTEPDTNVVIVSFRADEPQKMQFSLSSPDEESEENVNIGAPYTGSVALAVNRSVVNNLNISGTGVWNATVSYLSTTNTFLMPLRFSGKGSLATPVFYLEKGDYFFEQSSTNATPLYELHATDGSFVMNKNVVIPRFGSLKRSTVGYVPQSGTYYLNVITDYPNDWSLSIRD